MSQENAAWTIQGLFLRCPPASNRFCYEVLRHDPSIIDLIFKAATIQRPPWYADSEVDSILCESLAMIFRLPDLVIPGMDIKVGYDSVQKEWDEDWEAFVDCLRLLTLRPNLVESLLGVWNRLEGEKAHVLKRYVKIRFFEVFDSCTIIRMVMEAEPKYFAQSSYDPEDFYKIFESRGEFDLHYGHPKSDRAILISKAQAVSALKDSLRR